MAAPTDLPSPAEIDAFWEKTLSRCRADTLDAQVDRIHEGLPYYKYRVTYRSLDGVRVRAYLGVPGDDKPGAKSPRRWPVVVGGPGYGGWEFGVQLSDCQNGYLVLQVYPRGQGESGALWRVPSNAYQAWVNVGRDNPEGFFYQGAYMDLVRGLDYVLTRPDADPDRVGAMGTSQGGMLALGHAGVDRRIKAAVAHVPALCDFRHSVAQVGSQEINDPVFLRTWDFFEPLNLAPRVSAATILSSGGRDTTCPPATIQAVFDKLPGIKCLSHYPDLEHSSSRDFQRMSWEWMEQHLA